MVSEVGCPAVRSSEAHPCTLCEGPPGMLTPCEGPHGWVKHLCVGCSGWEKHGWCMRVAHGCASQRSERVSRPVGVTTLSLATLSHHGMVGLSVWGVYGIPFSYRENET